MFGFGKAFLWLLAIVGGVVVVRKYGPRLLSSGGGSSAKQLHAKGGNGVVLVPCSPGGKPGVEPLMRGVQSSPTYRWCYLVRAGDSAGAISERITGDSARYAEIIVANPAIPKKGKMGVVMGPDAWDFADGLLAEGTKIFVPQTMNAWVDPFGQSRGGYLPWPPDSRSIIEVEELGFFNPIEHESEPEPDPVPAPPPPLDKKDGSNGLTVSAGYGDTEGFDYDEEGAAA